MGADAVNGPAERKEGNVTEKAAAQSEGTKRVVIVIRVGAG